MSSVIVAATAAERPIGRPADLVAGLEPDEHQVAALGPEVDATDVIDDDRKAGLMVVRDPEVDGVVAPRLDRDVETDGLRERRGPCARDVDDRAGREGALVGLDARDMTGRRRSRGQPGSPGRGEPRRAGRLR